MKKASAHLSRRIVVMGMMLCVGLWASSLFAGDVKFKGNYERLNEKSTHISGKVQIAEFADFYCPHCHMFEQTAIPFLGKEFGSNVEVTMVGYPVIRGMLPTAFLMYEVAKTMGKGPEMKRVLFRTIHKDHVAILDRTIRGVLIQEVGLDSITFEKGLASKETAAAFQAGKAWGERIRVSSTPTVLLDGNIKVEGKHLNPQNLKTVIQSILEADVQK